MRGAHLVGIACGSPIARTWVAEYPQTQSPPSICHMRRPPRTIVRAMDLIEARPLSGALGAEITGVDLSRPLGTAAVAEIRQALLDHLVVFFARQELTPTSLLAFARNLGEPLAYPQLKGLPEEPLVDRGHQAGARAGRLRRRMAHRHQLPGAAADGKPAVRGGTAAVGRGHLVRQPVPGLRAALGGTATDPRRADLDLHLRQAGGGRDPRGAAAGSRARRRWCSPASIQSCAPIRRPAARRCT